MRQSTNRTLTFDNADTRKSDAKPGSGVARRVGIRLKSLRKARKISLVQLAEVSGLSLGLLSGLERGSVSPTLRSLTALADAFGVPPVWFYDLEEGAHSGEVVLKRGNGRKIMWSDGIEKVLLSPDLGGNLELLLVTIAPRGSSGLESYTHDGEEAGYVLDGTLELWVDNQRFLVGPGDSFAFESTRAHRFGNPGDAPTRLLWATTPPLYQGRGSVVPAGRAP